MKYTTIKLNLETKVLLDSLKPREKTYEEFIKELIDIYFKYKFDKDKRFREFLKKLDIDIKSWKDIVIKAYKNLNIKDLERIVEKDPDLARKIIEKLK